MRNIARLSPLVFLIPLTSRYNTARGNRYMFADAPIPHGTEHELGDNGIGTEHKIGRSRSFPMDEEQYVERGALLLFEGVARE